MYWINSKNKNNVNIVSFLGYLFQGFLKPFKALAGAILRFLSWVCYCLYDTFIDFLDFINEHLEIDLSASGQCSASGKLRASGNGDCLFNSLALGFADALAQMPSEERVAYQVALTQGENPVWNDFATYFKEVARKAERDSKTVLDDFSDITVAFDWLASKNVQSSEERGRIEQIWSPALRHLTVKYNLDRLGSAYKKAIDAVSAQSQNENMEFFDSAFIAYPVPRLTGAQWREVYYLAALSNDALEHPIYMADFFSLVLATCARVLGVTKRVDQDNTFFRICGNKISALFDEHHANITDCTGLASMPLGEEALVEQLLPNIMENFLKKGGWLEDYLKQLKRPGAWASAQEIIPLISALKWNVYFQEWLYYPSHPVAGPSIGIIYSPGHYDCYLARLVTPKQNEIDGEVYNNQSTGRGCGRF